MLKGLEKINRWNLDNLLELHPLDNIQLGFRKGYSTESAILHTVYALEKRILNKQYSLGVFLDIQSAFDSILPENVRDKLLKHGCPPDASN